jgi:bifunctional DNA-binding transcriptional regulator/antitoxin component of YhaV-PrlF toxin-antitoxin module
MKKGRCMKNAMVYDLSTVNDKGQIAIPIVIRRERDLKKGEKLFT